MSSRNSWEVARRKIAAFPRLLAECSKEGSVYAKCVSRKEHLQKNDCSKEFQEFYTCIQKHAKKTA
ncbi:NADH dehydrogenase [ubiquinone] 1 alpha subcomplex assembly factor 8-like [Saccoglossus kowalevskii]